jgi:hypothetical protein
MAKEGLLFIDVFISSTVLSVSVAVAVAVAVSKEAPDLTESPCPIRDLAGGPS